MIAIRLFVAFACIACATSIALGAGTPLHNAAKDGDLQEIKSLVKQGSDLKAKDDNGQTPLHVAIRSGKFDVAKYLCEKGSDIEAADDTGRTPLIRAAEAGVRQMVMQPFSNSATSTFKPYEGQFEMVKFLVKKGAKVDTANRDGATPLIAACYKSLFDIAEFLISKKANVNAQTTSGRSVLFIATFTGDKKLVELLLKKGANPNVAVQEEGQGKGQTPLIVASAKGYVEKAKLLIQYKADVNARDGAGKTPLKWTKNPEMVKLLKNAGAK